jgi:outer membrane murein-binding lipoprotein Lpp
MRFKLPLPLCVLALAAALAVPTSAPAKVTTLTGQVVGSTFPSGARVAVPVLLDARSRKRANMRAPLALLKLPRSARPRAPKGQRVTLDQLRAGDVFKVTLTVPRAARRAAYPAMNAGATRFLVTKRGTALSAAELQAEIVYLNGYLGQLTAFMLGQFADLHAQVASLRSDLTGLQAAVSALQAKVGSLPTDVAGQITTLITQVSQLQSELQTLTTQLNTATSDIATLAGKLTGIAPGDLADALADIAALQALVGGVNVGNLSTQVSTLSSKIGTVGGTDLQTQINQANAALGTAQSQLSFLCSSGLVKGPLLGLSLLGSCPS